MTTDDNKINSFNAVLNIVFHNKTINRIEYVTITVNRNLSNCGKAWKKGFRGFNGIRTRGHCVSAAVLYQPELWRPIYWRPANLLSSSTHERNETQNEIMWTAGIQWIEYVTIAVNHNLSNCDSLRWSHTQFICIPAVHTISFCGKL